MLVDNDRLSLKSVILAMSIFRFIPNSAFLFTMRCAGMFSRDTCAA